MPTKKSANNPSAKKSTPGAPILAKSAPVQPEVSSDAIASEAVLNASRSYANIKIEPPAYDVVAAKAWLEVYRPRLDALAADKLAVPRVDVRGSALAALGVHAFVTQVPALLQRFQKLHSIGEFNIANLDHLKAVSSLVLYTFAQAEAAGAFENDAKVPAQLAQEGSVVEKRMQELCEYKFKRDPVIAKLLAALRPGTGHADLAADLLGYADIYELRPDEVASDTTNYKAMDVADARRIAGEIVGHLAAAMSPKAREAYTLLRRAWTLLLQIYFEVEQVGTALMRYDPHADDWFPSLFAAGRSGRPRKKAKEGAAKEATGQGNPPTG